MKYVRRIAALCLVSILIFIPTITQAITSIEGGIQNATGIMRTVDARLQARAIVRAQQLVAADRLFHCCFSVGESEIAGWNIAFADPIATVVGSWMTSPPHYAIIIDSRYTRIGCGAAHSPNGKWFFDCILALPYARGPAPKPKPILLPNTAFKG